MKPTELIAAWCLVCDLGRHELCTGYSRPMGGERERCACDYPRHPKNGRRRWTLPPVGSARTAAAVLNP